MSQRPQGTGGWLMSPLSAPRPPAMELMAGLGLDPDPWQLDVLEGGHARLLLNCCRQAGKSTVVAMLALAESVWTAGTIVLLVSRSQRQSEELFRIMTDAYRRLGQPMKMQKRPGPRRPAGFLGINGAGNSAFNLLK